MAMTTKELLQMVDKKVMDNAIARNQDALQNHYTRTAPASNSSVSARVLDANALAAAQAAVAAQNAQAAARNTATATPTVTKTPTTTTTSSGTKKASTSVSAPSYSGGGYSGGGGDSYSDPGANALSLLAQNYNNSVRAVNDRYNLDEQNLRNDAEKQLREAYINYMISRKNAANDMARLGYTGGLTESNLARLNNNYGTIRNDINRRLDESVREYTLKRNADLLSLLNNYNNQQMRYAL